MEAHRQRDRWLAFVAAGLLTLAILTAF